MILSNSNTEDTSRWEPVIDMMSGARPITMGPMHAYQMRHTPRRILYTASYYKFAAKMIHKPQEDGNGESVRPYNRVLDLGCGEGIGTWMLAKECGAAHGIDIDADLVDMAKQNWTNIKPEEAGQKSLPPVSFDCTDFLTMKANPEHRFDGVASMDVIEHILPENADQFIGNIADHLTDQGVAVIGTPNITSSQYASAVTNAGHVNMYSGEKMQEDFKRFFKHVFVFAANDEVIHTGFFPMAHYLIAVACGPIRN